MDDQARKIQVRARNVFKVAAINLVFFFAVAILIPIFGASFAANLFHEGLYSELSAYCVERPCKVAPATVSAVYLLQAFYCLLFLVWAWGKAILSRARLKSAFLISALIAMLLIITVGQQFGFERDSIFANRVYDYPIYLMQPAFLMIAGCLTAHTLAVMPPYILDKSGPKPKLVYLDENSLPTWRDEFAMKPQVFRRLALCWVLAGALLAVLALAKIIASFAQ
ncbi:hypothetical protein [Altererythrobacter sp. Root672]|uniref:hypothetical protein n=1 Tax=Altererythrobacter sp. Root672 TaxID=1736584 RepID=UPI0006FF4E0F|nr:hypothetical protein [Altererythrobacter sp. Root672]KRA83727.1 hypothetical protein ASD76_06825 [Altererythrobacter sp. Root672]